MTTFDDTNELVLRVADGDLPALDTLLAKHRRRLKHLVCHRLDQRLFRRVDPSDVVQDTLAQAAQHVDQFLADGSVPFYPWLRKIAIHRMIDLRRTHVEAERRSVQREVHDVGNLSSEGHAALVQKLVQIQDSPSEQLIAAERECRVRNALSELKEADREVLALRFLEQLTTTEAAAVLEISENTFAQRLVRALRRVKKLLEAEDGSNPKKP